MGNSVTYEKVTYKQIDDMKHALGFDKRKVHGIKHRRYKPYRNYFNAGRRDIEDWEQLVTIGFATKSHENWYHVTADGRIYLEWVTGVEFLPESN